MLGLGLDLGNKNKQAESAEPPLATFGLTVGALGGDLWLGYGGATSGLNIGSIDPNPIGDYLIEALVRNKDTPSGFIWIVGDYLEEVAGKEVYIDGVMIANGGDWFIESALYTSKSFSPWPAEIVLVEGNSYTVEIK